MATPFNQGAPTIPVVLNTSNCFVFGNTASGNALSVQQLGTGNVATFRTTTGATALFVGANGNVGVGTTNPQTALDVFTGTMNAATVSATTLTGAGSGITALNMGNAGSGTLAVARGGSGVTTSTGTGSVVLSASPALSGTATFAAITTSGNVGIGTASPVAGLHCFSTTNASLLTGGTPGSGVVIGSDLDYGRFPGEYSPVLHFRQSYFTAGSGSISTGGIAGYKTVANGSFGGGLAFLYCANGATTLAQGMTLTDAGRVGIGTTNPGYPLVVNGSNTAYQFSITSYNSSLDFNCGTRFGTLSPGFTTIDPNGGSPQGLGIWDHLAINGTCAIGSAYAQTTPTPANSLIVSGRVGIGAASPGYPLEVSGTAYMSGTVYVGTTNTDPTLGRVNGINLRSDGRIFSRSAGHSFGIDSTSGTQIQFWTDNGSSRVATGAITSSGATTSYTSASDYRLKDNFAPITGALNIISSLNPVTYTWKSDGSPGHGFIAHELQEVVPDAVVGEKDAVDSDGNIKPQGIDKSYLISYLTAAIQELSAKNAALEARLAALEGTVGSLVSPAPPS